MGTQQGVCVYDGFQFRYPDTARIINAVRSMDADRDGNVWLATDRGLYVFSEDVLTPVTFDDGRPTSVWDVAIDVRGRVWCATEDGPAIVERAHLELLPELVGTSVLSVAVERDTLWFGGRQDVIMVDPISRTVRDKIAVGSAVWAVTFYGTDLWIGSDVGLFRFRDVLESMGARMGMVGVSITSFLKDRSGNLWMGTDHGAYLFNGSGTARQISTDEGLSHSSVYEMYQDREGCIWFATEIGASCLTSLAFLQFDRNHELIGDAVWSVCLDPLDRLWVGTDRGISVLQKGRSIARWRATDGLPSSVVRALASDVQGMWVGTTRGLALIAGQDVHVVDPLEQNYVRCLMAKQGQLWVGTNAAGAWLSSDGGSSWHRVMGLPNPRIYAIAGLDDGSVWLGTEDGLAIWRNGIMEVERPPKLPDARVLSILPLGQHHYWVGTDSGLAEIKAGEITHYTTENGLVDGVCYFILPGSEEDVWVGTNQGLTQLTSSGTNHFTELDGLSYREMNVGAALVDRQGFFWLGSYRGLTRVDLPLIPDRGLDHPIRLDQVKVFGQNVPTQDLRLAHHQNYLRFEYSAVCTRKPSALKFRTRISGLDREWNLTSDRHVQYAGLKPGNYQFEVEVADHRGVFGAQQAMLRFYIAPPFWQSLWFRLLGLSLVAALAFWAYSDLNRRNRLLRHEIIAERAQMMRKEAELRLMHAQMNPHFIQNTLNNAIYFAHNDAEKSEQILTWLSKMLRHSFNTMAKVWANCEDELDLCRNYLEIQALRFESRLSFECHMDPELSEEAIPSLSLQPLVENAVVHGFRRSRAKQLISVDIRLEGTWICVEVINPGPPLGHPFSHYIKDDHALGNIEARLKLLCGRRLEYSYSEGKHHVGFRFQPLDRAHRG